MENRELSVRETMRDISIAFYGIWLLAAVLLVLFETEVLPMGIVDDKAVSVYYFKLVGISLALVLVPISLKYFHRYVKQTSEMTLAKYRRASLWRLTALATPFFFNLFIYFLTLNRSAGFMALLVLVATIFCLPNRHIVEKIYSDSKQDQL